MLRATAIASATLRTPPSEPGTTGMPSALAVVLASILSPIMSDVFGTRPDEVDPVLGKDLGEPGILRKKAVAGMDRLRARDLAGRHDRRNGQIAVARRRRADAHALIGQPDMHRILIGR